MERDGVPSAARGDHRRRHRRRGRKRGPAGLEVKERDGHWHITGTLRAKGRSRRIRKSTELPALPQTYDDAQAIRREWEGELLDELVHGKKPSVPVAVAADQFLSRPRKRPLNGRDIAIVTELAEKFAATKIAEIPEGDWVAFVDARNAGNKPQTRERYITGVVTFLNWCAKKPRRWLEDLPEFERNQEARKPKHRRARRVDELTPEIIMLMIDNAAPHLMGQMAAEWSTGARVSSVLFGCRLCDLLLAPGREQITYHDTKNGEPVVAAIHPWAAMKLRQYLEWRGDLHDREAPLFVTPRIDRRTKKKLPYSDRGRGMGGGHNKTAFNGMKRRTLATLRRRAIADARARRGAGDVRGAAALLRECRQVRSLVRQVTQHWFRHLLATTVMATSGNLRAAMDQGGWLTIESVQGYTHDVPEARRGIVDQLPIGAPLPGPAKKEQA
jgi:site-specific recombinase XerD